MEEKLQSYNPRERRWTLQLRYGELRQSYQSFSSLPNGILGGQEALLCGWVLLPLFSAYPESSLPSAEITGELFGPFNKGTGQHKPKCQPLQGLPVTGLGWPLFPVAKTPALG